MTHNNLRALAFPSRAKGQSAVIIAVSMLALLVVVGLAVDGGSMYGQRRQAQNSSDAAALAATKQMLIWYNEMVLNYAYDVPGTADQDRWLRQVVDQYAQEHGIVASNLEAYYVNDNKQVIGTGQVGRYGSIPWPDGAKGVAVTNRSETDSFFMKIMGWNKVGAVSTSTAFMGIAVDSGQGLPVLPIGFFTGTNSLNLGMEPGRDYTLLSGENTYGSGTWGYINFNGQTSGSAQLTRAWMNCGFNAYVVGDAGWTEWANGQGDPCAQYANVNGAGGPAMEWPCANPDDPTCAEPAAESWPYPACCTRLQYGYGQDGWWVLGSTGTAMANCHDLENLVSTLEGAIFYIPIFDKEVGGGANALFHLRTIAKFYIAPDSYVNCNIPQPNGELGQKWNIHGTFLSYYQPGATGRHGNIRYTSGHVVFLDN